MPTPADLPKSVTTFLKAYVADAGHLRFLLAMHSAPGGTTSLSLLARALDLAKNDVRELASAASGHGLIRMSSERLELSPTSIADRLALAELAQWYGRARTVVLDALHALHGSTSQA